MDEFKYRGCLMATLKVDDWDTLRKQFATDDLTGPGFEKDPHITILYGIESHTPLEDIKSLIKNNKLIGKKVELSKVSAFTPKEYDVVKYEVTDPSLFANLKLMYTALLKGVENKQTFDKYNPHCTIAYVKSGTSEKYLKSIPSIKAEITDYWYSTRFTL